MLVTSLSCTADKEQLMSSRFSQTLAQLENYKVKEETAIRRREITVWKKPDWVHYYALNYIWQNSTKCSKDDHLNSSHVPNTLYCLAYCSAFIIPRDDVHSDCCASGTSGAIYIWEQHKVITVCQSVKEMEAVKGQFQGSNPIYI